MTSLISFFLIHLACTTSLGLMFSLVYFRANYKMKRKPCWDKKKLGLFMIFTCLHGIVGLEVRISTDPPGPQYPAAVWVRFSCNVYNHPRPESFSYHWKATCNNTGQVQFTMSNPDGSDFVWVQSTPPFCQDYLECTATDDTGSSISAGKLISGITG